MSKRAVKSQEDINEKILNEFKKIDNNFLLNNESSLKRAVEIYSALKAFLYKEEGNGTNPLFKGAFTDFYRIGRGTSDEYRKNYFERLEIEAKRVRNNEIVEFDIPNESESRNVLKSVWFDEKNNKMQFSFFTKFMNIINENYPIYDSYVMKALGLNAPNSDIKKYCRVYEHIREASKHLKEKCSDKICLFREKFSVNNEELISDMRIVDFLVWQLGADLINKNRKKINNK